MFGRQVVARSDAYSRERRGVGNLPTTNVPATLRAAKWPLIIESSEGGVHASR
jgi:hypothetical protein